MGASLLATTALGAALAAGAGAPGAAETAAAGARPVLPMVLCGLVLVATFALIAFEVINKVVAALAGAIVTVVIALVLGVYAGPKPYLAVHRFIEHDLGVIGVIVGTSILVEIAGASGLFHFIAVRLVKLTGGRPERLLPAVFFATIGFVTFLTIAPGTLIMASLVLVITRALSDDPRPYIVGLALAANSGALMTFASGIVTLMIGTSAGIPYAHFLVVSLPLGLLSAAVAFFWVRLSYRAELAPHGDPAARAAMVARFDEWALVKDRRIFYRSAIILLLTIAGFASAQALGVGLDFIAMCGGTAAILFSGFDPEEAIKKVKWPVVLFFVGLFVMIGTVQETGLLEVLAGALLAASGDSVLVAAALLISFSFVLAGLVDNIPTAATLIPMVKTMVARGLAPEPLWWGLVAACNLGGNPTPVGSIAAVIALHALEKERGIKVGWGEYLKVGGTVTLLQLVLVIAYIFAFRELGLFPRLG
ncbi:MAG: transporter [Planctomycetota bacterium]|nr:MAG: transporter [Planctomycetota bacterium]